MNTIIKVKINKLEISNPLYEEGYRYIAQQFTSKDGGNTFYYAGIGRLTLTKKEAMKYKSLKEAQNHQKRS